jgi:hypothetical protein
MEERLRELHRMRWLLWGLALAAAALGWVTGPLLWALAVISLILAVWNEVVIRQGHRLQRTQDEAVA